MHECSRGGSNVFSGSRAIGSLEAFLCIHGVLSLIILFGIWAASLTAGVWSDAVGSAGTLCIMNATWEK
jgi:hypothetical protein